MRDEQEECHEVHFVGEENTLFYIDCGIDVSAASLSEIFIRRPDNTTIKKTATPVIYNTSPDWLTYRIDAIDFNQAGKYKGQAFVQIGSWSGWGQPFYIKVEQPISSSSSSSSCRSSSSSSSSMSSSSSSRSSSSSSSSSAT